MEISTGSLSDHVPHLTARPVSLLLGGLIAYILLHAIYLRTLHPLAKVPGPLLASITKLWLFTKMRKLNIHRVDLDLHEKYGEIVRVAPNQVHISDPAFVKPIYGALSKFRKSDWYRVTSEGVDPGDTLDLLNERNMERYKLQRRLVGPVYSINGIKRHENHLNSTLSAFMDRMKGLKGEPFELVKWTNIWAIDTLTEITFGHRNGYIENGDDAGDPRIVDKAWRLMHVLGLFPSLWVVAQYLQNFVKAVSGRNWLATGEFESVTSIVKAVQEIEERNRDPEKSREKGPDIFTDLSILHNTKPEFKEKYMFDMTLTNFGAGFETMATTLNGIICNIAKSPECQLRIQKEIDALVLERRLDEPPMYDQAVQLSYLQAAILEGMRLHPVIATILPRTVPLGEKLIVNGHTIPGGVILGINPYVLHRHTSMFGTDAQTFRPERWLECSKEKRKQMEGSMVHFGGASRSCPGQNLASIAMLKLLTALFMSFEVELVAYDEVNDGKPFVEEVAFALKWYNVYVKLVERR